MNLDLADSNSPLRPDGAVVSLEEAASNSPIQTEALRRLDADAVWKRCTKCDVHRRLPRLDATSIKPSEAWACEKFQQLDCDIPNDTWDDVVYHCITNSVSFLIHWDTATPITPALEEESETTKTSSKTSTATSNATSSATSTATSTNKTKKNEMSTKSAATTTSNAKPGRVVAPAVVTSEFAPTRRSTRGSSSAELLSLPYRYGNQDWDPIFRCWKPSTIVGKKEVAVPEKTPPPTTTTTTTTTKTTTVATTTTATTATTEKVVTPPTEKVATPEKSSPRKRAASPTKTGSVKR